MDIKHCILNCGCMFANKINMFQEVLQFNHVLSFVTINIILLELVAKCHLLLLGHMSKIIMDSLSHVCACVLNQFNSY